MKRRGFLAGVVAAVAVIAGRTAADTPTPAPDTCEQVSEQTVAWLNTLANPGVTISGPAAAVRAEQFENVWFVAAMAGGEPAVWAINTITEDHGVTLSVTDRAKETTGWFHADTSAAKITEHEPGVAEALACLASFGTPVASPVASPVH